MMRCAVCHADMEPVPEVGWLCFDHPSAPGRDCVAHVTLHVLHDRSVDVDGHGLAINHVVQILEHALGLARTGEAIMARRSALAGQARWN